MVVKRCPFCGGEAKTGRSFTKMYYQVGCKTKGCYGYIDKSQLIDTEQDAADQWNARPEGVTTGWIKCGDDMPKFNERILLTDGNNVIMSVRIDDTEGGSYFSGMDSEVDIDSLRWMYLPDTGGKENAK